MSPLANQDPLAQLNDIIGPTTASPWPPAPIYWFLGVLLIAVIGALIYLLKHFKQQRQKQRDALAMLSKLQREQASFILLNKLLKGVALSYFPRTQVASLHGQQWFDFLQGYSTENLFAGKESFLKHLYRYSEQPCSPEHYIQAKKWITQLPRQIKKHRKEAKKHV